MAATQTPPLTLSYSDNSSSICYPSTLPRNDPSTTALQLLSTNLESLFNSDFCSDATIIAQSSSSRSPREIPIHRCILASRSPFFKEVFGNEKENIGYDMRELGKDVVVSYEPLMVVLGYMYTGRVGNLPGDGVCDCADWECRHVACRPKLDCMIEVLYASSIFQISELVSLFQRHLLDILEKAVEDDILVILSVANLCGNGCEKLLARCIEIITCSTVDVVTLEKTLPSHIVKQILGSRAKMDAVRPDALCIPDKHVKRIHRALDSDDIELVKMLLEENPTTTLDDACALHYAVAHCDSKITEELLDLALADVNHRNARGYTVLHVAAIRREPAFIVSLLAKGAQPSDLTLDGRKAIHISWRLTKLVDYKRGTEEGKQSHNDWLCIDILENAESNHLIPGEGADSLPIAGEALKVKLLYLETRVGVARLLFPKEAKIAMGLANVGDTSECNLDNDIDFLPNPKEQTIDDLNEERVKRVRRMNALSKTVKYARQYFPRCAKKLDEIMDNFTEDIAFYETKSYEERQQRKRRYLELRDLIMEAFNEDKEQNDRSTISSASSSTLLTKGIWVERILPVQTSRVHSASAVQMLDC